MKHLLCCLAALLSCSAVIAGEPNMKVLVVTGGHPFEREAFYKIFSDNPAVTFTAAEHDKAGATVWDRKDLANFDAVAMYDMPMVITEAQKAGFLSLFQRGTGVLVLHHALVSFPDWADYERLIGGHYPKPPSGERQVTSKVGYEHGQEIPVVVLDPQHFITRGLKDFTIHDEIYWGFRVGADVHPLLTNTHPRAGKPIMWTREEGRSRLVYLQLGHDHSAYENAQYRTLVARSLLWVTRRE